MEVSQTFFAFCSSVQLLLQWFFFLISKLSNWQLPLPFVVHLWVCFNFFACSHCTTAESSWIPIQPIHRLKKPSSINLFFHAMCSSNLTIIRTPTGPFPFCHCLSCTGRPQNGRSTPKSSSWEPQSQLMPKTVDHCPLRADRFTEQMIFVNYLD